MIAHIFVAFSEKLNFINFFIVSSVIELNHMSFYWVYLD